MAAITVALAAVWKFFASMPDWLKRLLGIVLLAGVIFYAGQMRGERIATAECTRKAELAKNAAKEQDAQAQRDVQQHDDQVQTWLTEQKKRDDATIADLTTKLAARTKGKVDPCVYDDLTADPDPGARRLRK